MVAGGSLRAMEAILRGDVEHAFHPGGGLHHAMPDRASGFCIYDDPALAIARARRDGLRVLYVDLDVHHGDGVQAIHWDDPGVLTRLDPRDRALPVPGHRRGRGARGGRGGRDVASTSRSSPGPGEGAWLAAVRDAPPRAGRRVRAGPHRVAARRRLARLGSAGAPARDDDRDGRGGPARRRASRTGTPAVAGWRPVAAATTRIGSCRGPGASSGWPARIARSRRRRRRAGASAGRPRRPATARRRCRRRSTIRRTPGSTLDADAGGGRDAARSRRSAVVRAARRATAVCRGRATGAGGTRSGERRDGVRCRDRADAAASAGRRSCHRVDAATSGRGSRSRRASSRRRPAAGHALVAGRDPRRRQRRGGGRRDARRRARDHRPDRRRGTARPARPRRGAGLRREGLRRTLPRGMRHGRPARRRRVTSRRSPSPSATRSSRSIARLRATIARRLLERRGLRDPSRRRRPAPGRLGRLQRRSTGERRRGPRPVAGVHPGRRRRPDGTRRSQPACRGCRSTGWCRRCWRVRRTAPR